jgi:uncharacterized phage protein (predicted DNA packaging)
MAVTLQQVKDYLRIDADHEDALLQTFMAAADSYLAASIDGYADKLTDADFASKSDMVKLALVSEFYRNRDPSNDQRDNLPFYIQSQIAQLQYWADVEAEP